MELIKIQQVNLNGEAINSVHARELHEKLEVGRDFSNWIKQRLEETQAVENKDFTVFAKFGENSLGGRPSNEYLISLDTAKHIAMLEKSEIGRKIRQYFIDVEKKMRGNSLNCSRKWKNKKEKKEKKEKTLFFKQTKRVQRCTLYF